MNAAANTAVIRTTDPTTGLRPWWTLSWRTQSHRCDGQEWARWDEATPPVRGTDDRGRPLPAVSQCGTCGSLRSARVRIERADGQEAVAGLLAAARARLDAAEAGQADARDARDDAIRQARDAGWTVAAIMDGLGVARQTVYSALDA